MLIPVGNEIKQLEQWKEITSDIIPDILPYYMISTYGRVYNQHTGNYLPQNINYEKDKYITISLATTQGHVFAQIHRLVMMVFANIPDSELYDVNHIDGIKYHNWIWNLEWLSHRDNVLHGIKTNLFPHGEDRLNSKLSNADAGRICELMSQGYSPIEIESILTDLTNCSIQKIYHNIRRGHSWKEVSCNYDLRRAQLRPIFTKTQVDRICTMLEQNSNITNMNILINLGYCMIMNYDDYDFVINCIREKSMYRSICEKYNYQSSTTIM